MKRVLPSARLRLPFCVLVTLATYSEKSPGLFSWGQSTARANEAANSAGAVQFNRDIRPILSDHCFACHGPDSTHREADLRLDTREGLLGGAAPEPATIVPVIPHSLEDSPLWHRIAATDASEQMPPPDFGKPLSPEQKESLRRWIDQGAAWEGHWAFASLARSTPPDESVTPEVPASFLRNEIDLFVLQAMRRQGLSPSDEATSRDLIRRLSFDLHGLPPLSEQAVRFIADDHPLAYEQMVDQLLDSPQFGERMAMWWLDLVRYADSVGYHGDQPVSVSPYRDYVIDSFNRNKPFDQFTIEQLAGDLLPEPTLEQKIASGYNRLGMMSAEGGVQPKEYLSKYIAERVRNLSGAWLGVTLGCCECHDHKYDPFTAKDFYSFEAFFADIQEQGLYAGSGKTGQWGSSIQVPTEQQRQQIASLDQQIAAINATLALSTPELEEAQRKWESEQPRWITLRPQSMVAVNGTQLEWLEDGSMLASGPVPATDIYGLTIADPSSDITHIRLEVLPHDSLPQKGPGRAENGNFVVSEVRIAFQADHESGAQAVEIRDATASYEQIGAAEDNPYKKWGIAAAIDHDARGAKWGWGVMEKVGQPHWALFETKAPIGGGAGSRLFIVLQQLLDNPGHSLGRFRLSATSSTGPLTSGESLPGEIVRILERAAEERSQEQRTKLAEYFRSITPRLQSHREQLAKREAERRHLDDVIATTLVTVSVTPRPVRVLARGNWMDESGEIVQPGVPSFLPALGTAPGVVASRLDLARWVVDPKHPLTARVLVNRIWKLMFGAGLSRKLDDLGAQGEPPSHPELLDFLAQRMIDTGWDIKQLVKLIAMSGTYRQTSMASPQQNEIDAFNRWLSHQSRYRLEAEMVRDNALRISGLLVEKLGGPSVKPYQPPGYWSYLNFPPREWQNDTGDKLYRRGLYTHWQRQYLHPSMLAFDAPSREECTADRPRSNTPLQSLVLLNDPIFVEAARTLAQATLQDGDDSFASRLDRIYARAVSRRPSAQEQAILKTLYEKHLGEYAGDPDSAKALIQIGDAPIPEAIAAAELAAWTSVARTVLNLHEVIVRY